MAYDASATPAPATHALATRGVANHRRPNHRRQAPGAEKHQPQLRSRSPLPATCVEGSWIDLCCVSRLSPKFKHHHNGKTRALIPASKHSTSGYSPVGLNSPAPPDHVSGMLTLTLDDDELRALCDLLTDVTRRPTPFPLSPKRQAWLSALEKLTKAAEEEARPKGHRAKSPA